jgi:hypothetical protein
MLRTQEHDRNADQDDLGDDSLPGGTTALVSEAKRLLSVDSTSNRPYRSDHKRPCDQQGTVHGLLAGLPLARRHRPEVLAENAHEVRSIGLVSTAQPALEAFRHGEYLIERLR